MHASASHARPAPSNTAEFFTGEGRSLFSRAAILLYGVVCYAIFFTTFCYAVGFVGNFLVPRSIDGEPVSPLWLALLVNAGLLGVFAVQHSVMARPTFKKWWMTIVPPAAERATYTLLSSLTLIALFVFWQPMGGVVWNIEHPAGRMVMYGLFAFGWALVLYSTFLINHFDLFGLRQVWIYFRGRAYRPLRFTTPGPYRLVRHPLYVGWLFAFWATPTMTVAHLVFAVLTTAYILIAIQLEERNLVQYHGPAYTEYRKRVPMLIPNPARRINSAQAAELARAETGHSVC